jgi:Uncharacterized protein conserved in bacteria (DUF2330)
MILRIGLVISVLAFCVWLSQPSDSARGCCPAPPMGKPVVNADQTVIIIWDAANRMQHFIRQASFKSDADDFGFIVPSPSEPELDESGNAAFPMLLKLTEPEVVEKKGGGGGGIGCGCSMAPDKASRGDMAEPQVKVLQDKLVAGFHAKVLEAKSATALVDWLKENGYAYSAEIEAWAKPYVDQGWKFTALKVAKDKDAKDKSVTAGALRISFKTDRPLFPYREPEYKSATDALGAKSRLLRIYFIADARYDGELTKENAWTGKVAWAGKVKAADRKLMLEHLKLPDTTGPADWWLTEFEDAWPYKVAPADVYFSRSANQDAVKREPITRWVSAPYPTDGTSYAFIAIAVIVPIWSRLRRSRRDRN